MEINILHMIKGAKAAKGLTVVIDVFRAFSLEAYMLAAGAEQIIPVGTVEEAYSIKRNNPDMILAGERHGKILPGFDTGNAPSHIFGLSLFGKTVIHTTSAGTQGVYNATAADEILVAGLVNAAATAKYIQKSGAEKVSLVCMGLEGISPTEEDTLCAEYIKGILCGYKTDMDREVEKLRYTSGAKFFDPAQWEIFPEEDFRLCTQYDKFDFVMKLYSGKYGCGYVRRIKV